VGVGGRRATARRRQCIQWLIGGGIVAGQLLCYLLLLALVAAEARETWTGLRNQGSQLLSTGIGIGAADAARDWLPTALAAARSVWPVWPVGVWPVGPVVCVCADAKTWLGIVSRSVVTCAHAVDACCQLLGLFVARRSAAAGPATSSSASSSANSPSPPAKHSPNCACTRAVLPRRRVGDHAR
jgi:hypothetical protein